MLAGNGLGFHPIVRHDVPLSDRSVWRPPAARAWQVHPAVDRSILLGHLHLLDDRLTTRRPRRRALPRGRVMSPWSKVRHSRAQWKHKATQRAEPDRSQRKQLARVKTERDRAIQALAEARARLCHLEAQSQGLAVHHKVDLVFLALQLVVVARIGFRAASRVLSLLAMVLGIQKAPCPQTIINWVTRLSIVRIQSARMLKGFALSQAPFSNGLIWMIDVSIALGAGKIVAVLALDAHHHHHTEAAPTLPQVRCIAVSVAASWTGDTLADLLKRLIAVMGRPAAYLKDGGSDLHKAVGVLDAQGLASPAMDDISHAVANMRKRRYHDHPQFATFVSACGRVSGKLNHSMLACLAPPTVHPKARFMHGHRLVPWADRLLHLSPAGGAKTGSTLATLRACLDALPACKALIKRFRDEAIPLLACQKILKTQGLSHHTLAQCEPLLDAIPSRAVRREFMGYLHYQLQTATTLGLDDIGLPISSDPIASLFGLAKQHGVGESKEAHRIALRLPALCGTPTREEAKQVLEVSVAEQQEITGRFTSLTKQRREGLPNPNALESLGLDQLGIQVERIPSSKNRSNAQGIINLSNGYKEVCGPGLYRQDGPPRLEHAVL